MGCGSSTPEDQNNNVKSPAKTRPTKGGGKAPTETEKDAKRDDLPELTSEPVEEEIDIPKTEKGYPAPVPPKDKKDDIFDAKKMKHIDKRARNAPPEIGDSYEQLVVYLTSECKTDVEKVRSIFMWMGNQDINGGNFAGVTGSDTPKGVMKLMKERKASYSTFFALLCRAAGIPCVIVEGYAKSVGYKVGHPEEEIKSLQNSWNAVYCGGGWRIVFPLWACSAVTGYSSGAYTKVEEKGKAVREKEEKTSGATIKILNEFYFFPDPEVFVFVALPLDSRWQLMQRKWDLGKFADVPYCRQRYFQNEIDIKSKFSCRLNTKNGEVEVEVTSADTKGLSLDYELYYDHEESGRELSASLQLNNYVLLARSTDTWTFAIRFPESGVYKLQIVGGKNGWESDLCAFRINCDVPQEDCKPLPYNPGSIGYGPSQETEQHGVKALSHLTGVVKMVVMRSTEMNFSLTRDVKVTAELMHATKTSEELQQHVRCTQNNRNVNVKVNIPEDGEYALVMHAQKKNESGYSNVVNYLLTSEDKGKKRRKPRNYETPIEKRTRGNVQDLSKTTGTGNIDELEHEVERFHKLDMQEKEGELTKAHDNLEYKKDRKALEDAIKRRHLETLNKAIDRGNNSRFKAKLTKQLDEAVEVRDHLVHLNKIAHDVLEMKQTTISELRSYKYPPEIIHDVMKSTFLMLGEKDINIEDWEDLQVLMGKMGKDSMLRRVRTFDTVKVQPDTQYRVERTLSEHAEDDVRKASAGAGTFYKWLHDVCQALDSGKGQQQQTGGREQEPRDPEE